MMKYFFCCCIVAFGFTGYSQNGLSFCAAVQEGSCVLNNNKFFSSPDSISMPVCLMYRNENGLSTTKLIFVINKLDEKDKESYFATMEQEVKPEWEWAYKTGIFPASGKFSVKVMTASELPLMVKTFEIFKP